MRNQTPMSSPPRKKNRPRLGLYLKERDVEVVATLWRYRLLRESALHRLCFPSVKHQRKVQARLKKLADEGYVGRRFPVMVHRSNTGYTDYTHQDRREVLYWIERRGVEEVINGGRPLDEEQQERLRYIKNLSERSEAYLNHRLDLADLRACLELAVAQTPGVLLAVWYDEHEKAGEDPILQARVKIRLPDTDRERPFTLCPDACFVLEDEKSSKQDLFFVEVDEGTESARKRWRDKVLAYCAYAGQGFDKRFAFRGKGFRVLTVTRSQKGKDQASRKARLLRTTYRAGGRGQFWFATFDQVMPDGTVTGEHFLTRGIWQRAREEDIRKKAEIVLYNHLFI